MTISFASCHPPTRTICAPLTINVYVLFAGTKTHLFSFMRPSFIPHLISLISILSYQQRRQLTENKLLNALSMQRPSSISLKTAGDVSTYLISSNKNSGTTGTTPIRQESCWFNILTDYSREFSAVCNPRRRLSEKK